MQKYLTRLLFINMLMLLWVTPVVAEVKVEVGDPAPAFLAVTLDGERVSLYQNYFGQKPVLLVFSATWCPNCWREIPLLNQLHSELGDRFAILGVNLEINDSVEKVRAYNKKHGITYPVIFDLGSRIMSAYNVFGTPTQIIVATNGTILYRGAKTPSIADIKAHWAELTVK